MKKVRITVEIDGEELTRDYVFSEGQMEDKELLGGHVVDLIKSDIEYTEWADKF